MEPKIPIPEEGKILLINKPYRWTSFDVVNKLRRIFGIKKIGHAGTLDPLATGLLIVCLGKMTKRIEEFMGQEKEYTGIMVIGQTTPSHDLETEVSIKKDITHITEQQIRDAATAFVGNISQVPPQHSAVLIGGKRAYSFARQGQEIELKPRQVEVSTFEITAINFPEVSFRIICSKGTYIRSLVRDFGNALGVGAYMSTLCRTRIGSFKLEDSLTLEQLNS
jgi:tRNA pseudouridine55 synthase